MQRKKTMSPFAQQISKFCVLFPNEEHCIKELAEERLKRVPPCSRCSGTRFKHGDTYKNYYCESCGKEFYTFAGTMYDSVQHFRPRAAAIWLARHNISPSASEFARFFSLYLSTGQDILRSVGFLLAKKMAEQKTVTISSAEFIEIYGCRSTETPAREHPRAEQLDLDLLFSETENKTDEAINVVLDAEEREILDKLSSNSAARIDEIIAKTNFEVADVFAALGRLQFKGLVEVSSDQSFKRKKKKTKPIDNEYLRAIAEKFKQFVKENWHRISRKYVQIYLAMFWMTQKENQWTDDLIFEFLDSEPVSRKSMQSYVSPYYLQVATRAA